MTYSPNMKKQERRCQTNKVRFSAFDAVVEIPNAVHWSQDETCTMWYTYNEVSDMRRDVTLITNLKFQGHQIPTEDCSIGLYTDAKSMNRRKDAIHLGILSVLMTQQLQWESYVNDPEEIATIYSDYTNDNRLEANRRASNLAKDVAETHHV